MIGPDYLGIVMDLDGEKIEIQTDIQEGSLRGKMRNTFGRYVLRNEGMRQVKLMGFEQDQWQESILTIDADQDLLGSFEFYYNLHFNAIMARQQDGLFFTFDLTGAKLQLNLTLNGKIGLHPIFTTNNVAVLYTK